MTLRSSPRWLPRWVYLLPTSPWPSWAPYPALTSVVICPLRPEQLADLPAGADLELGDAVFNRIDDIVPPGIDVRSPQVR